VTLPPAPDPFARPDARRPRLAFRAAPRPRRAFRAGRARPRLAAERGVLAAVALGGALGSVGRYGVTVATPAAGWPWATFGVNVSGSLLLGVLMGLVLQVWPPRRYLRPFLGVGVLGGWTTFSTYGVEAVLLARSGAILTAAAYVAASVLAAVVAVTAGLAAVRWLVARRVSGRGGTR
jgi:fluoride exporter